MHSIGAVFFAMPQSLWYNILTNAKETSMETINQILARELGREQSHIDNVIKLLDEGNTIPFIARYRKELHGAMDDTTLRKLGWFSPFCR